MEKFKNESPSLSFDTVSGVVERLDPDVAKSLRDEIYKKYDEIHPKFINDKEIKEDEKQLEETEKIIYSSPDMA